LGINAVQFTTAKNLEDELCRLGVLH